MKFRKPLNFVLHLAQILNCNASATSRGSEIGEPYSIIERSWEMYPSGIFANV